MKNLDKYKIQSLLFSDWILHTLIWIGYFLISLTFYLNYLPLKDIYLSFERVLLFNCVYIALFIPVPYLVIYLKNKINYTLLFLPLAIVLIFLISPFYAFIDQLFLLDKQPQWFLNTGHLFSRVPYLILLTFIVYWANIKSKYEHELKKKEEVEKLRKQAELDMLISQISPHFLFNALNNLNSLIYMAPSKASEHVVKISELLRYVIDDGEKDLVEMEKEICYLENYIELYSNKYRHKGSVEFQKLIEEKVHIQPLLFINFVENAFKHCRLQLPKDFIEVNLKVTAKAIEFECSNTFEKTEVSKDATSGIGLKNVKERLQLLYPESHTLKTCTRDDIFTVYLKIDR